MWVTRVLRLLLTTKSCCIHPAQHTHPFVSSLHVTPTGPSNPENCRQTLGIHAPVSVRTKRSTLFLSVSHTYLLC